MRSGGAPKGVICFTQSRFRRHHFRMLVLVTKSKGSDVGLGLRHSLTRFIYQSCTRNTWNCDKPINVIASLFDLPKLTFQSERVRFCGV